ncbi:MAG: class I SAM-dependent methyltransferase [Solirubrobacteraceae bacterium]
MELAPGVCTVAPPLENELLYRRRVLQAVADVTDRPLRELRVLDLGALEGGFAIEFAMHGAEVVAVEGRKGNCERIAFAAEVLGLDNLATHQQDVRAVTVDELGTFDVVLCLGLLYHLDAESVLPFLRNLAALTTKACVIDTHVALYDRMTITDEGRTYAGDLFVEHPEGATQRQIDESWWASLDTTPSFFFTEPSLLNALQDVGYSSVHRCEVPYYQIMFDRRTLICLRRERVALRSWSGHVDVAPTRPPVGSRDVVEPINRLPLAS